MIPAAPLPSWRDLARAPFSPASIGAPWRTAHAGAVTLFDAARWALAAAVRAAQQDRRCEVWLPAYICEEAVAPLRMHSRIRFYPIDDRLRPVWTEISPSSPGGAFVLVHYFGIPNDTISAQAFCSTNALVLIEDAAHALRPVDGAIGISAFTIFSPRKLLPVPEGGLLVSVTPQPHPQGQPAGAARWMLKRAAQALVLGAGGSWSHQYADDAREGGSSNLGVARPFGAMSRKLLSRTERDLERVATARHSNYQMLHDGLSLGEGSLPVFDTIGRDIAPYLFPIRYRRGRDEALRAFRARGVPAGRWPDLPVEVRRDAAHASAVQLQREILTLPVHQGLSSGAMQQVIQAARRSAPAF